MLNADKVTGCDHCARIAEEHMAPSTQEFLTMLHRRVQGGAMQPIRGIKSNWKVRRMQFCVAEGLRSMHREFLK